jgi:RimJ/RimL family protein N-acetyltransferase
MDETAPLPMIRGESVYLRASERGDLENYTRWLNDARVARYLSMDTPFSATQEEAWFDRMTASQGRDNYHFAICLRESGEAIGTIGLHGVDTKHGTAVMGIAIGDPDYWSRGYGSDALRALLDFGFGTLRLDRVELEVYAFNERARRSYERCGFVLEGTAREALYRDGRRHDVHQMAILRSEWASQDRPRSWELP